MKKIGLFWGSTTGNQQDAADIVCELIEKKGYIIDSFDIRSTSPSKMLEYSNLIIGCPTWNIGELQEDWEEVYLQYRKLDFNNITAAFFGAGDQISYSFNYLDAIGLLARPFVKNGGNLIGRCSTVGYEFDESEAIDGGQFLGLGIDNDNQEELTEKRINEWVEKIIDKFM